MIAAEEDQVFEMEEQRIRRILKKELPAYRNFQKVDSGAQAYIFEADFGPEGSRTKRFIRVDRMPVGVRATRNHERGCTNGNNVRALSKLPEAEAHNIVGIIDYREIAEADLTISIHPKVEGKNLERSILEDGPLGAHDLKGVFRDMIGAIGYCFENGELHRDVTPRNIMVKPNGTPRGRGKLLDFGSAGSIEDLEAKAIPTSGGTFVMDPLLDSRITGKEKAYDIGSELYSLASDMYFAATGRSMYRVIPDVGIFDSGINGENLLGEGGKIDFKRAKTAKKIALTEVKDRRLRKFLGRAITLDESKRYTSVEDFRRDFEKATGPGLVERVKGSWKQITSGVAILGLLAGGATWYALTQRVSNEDMQARLADANRFQIVSVWNPETLEINNNFMDLSYFCYEPKAHGQQLPNRDDPSKKYFRLKPGDRLNCSISAVEKEGVPKHGVITLDGVAYIEGFDGKKFKVDPVNYGGLGPDDWEGFAGYSGGEISEGIVLPENIREGIHVLAFEAYAPKYESKKEDEKRIIFPEEGRIVTRLRVPIVVGDIEEPAWFSGSRFSYLRSYMKISRVDASEGYAYSKSLPRGLSWTLSVPEEGASERIESVSGGNVVWSPFWFPGSKKLGKKLAHCRMFYQGRPIMDSFLPTNRVAFGRDNELTQVEVYIPGREFQGQIRANQAYFIDSIQHPSRP